MTHIAGHDRSQLLLLPEAVDDYVGADNPVRFIKAFVDGLDLAACCFTRVTAKATGRPGYAPGDLLKLYIYGYLNRVRSSRRLEAETHRNVEVIWLLRHLRPNFKTIADFRAENAKAFRAVFRQFVLLCRKLDLFGRELNAVDGTRIKAVNNKDRNFTKALLAAFISPRDGWLAFVENEGTVVYASSGWQSFIVLTVNGAGLGMDIREEEIVCSGASVTTSIAIPARSIVLAVSVRTTLAITGAASFDCGVSGNTSKFGGALGIGLGSTNIGVIGPEAFYADTPIILTAIGGNFTGGRVRVAIQFLTFSAPTN